MIESSGRGGLVVIQLVILIAEAVADSSQGKLPDLCLFDNFLIDSAFYAIHFQGVNGDTVIEGGNGGQRIEGNTIVDGMN